MGLLPFTGRIGDQSPIVLVTPSMLDKLRTDRSVANAELSALLRRNLLVPVMHGVTFEELDQVSPTLASRGGFSTAEEPMGDIVVKIAELVGTLADEEANELSMKSARQVAPDRNGHHASKRSRYPIPICRSVADTR